jgi:hypothetical protein
MVYAGKCILRFITLPSKYEMSQEEKESEQIPNLNPYLANS